MSPFVGSGVDGEKEFGVWRCFGTALFFDLQLENRSLFRLILILYREPITHTMKSTLLLIAVTLFTSLAFSQEHPEETDQQKRMAQMMAETMDYLWDQAHR